MVLLLCKVPFGEGKAKFAFRFYEIGADVLVEERPESGESGTEMEDLLTDGQELADFHDSQVLRDAFAEFEKNRRDSSCR